MQSFFSKCEHEALFTDIVSIAKFLETVARGAIVAKLKKVVFLETAARGAPVAKLKKIVFLETAAREALVAKLSISVS